MVNMGEKLKTLRLEHQLSQKQVAERIGVAVSAVSSYESGARYPSYAALIKLSGLFHVSTDYLLGLSERRYLDVHDLSEEQIAAIENLITVLRKAR